MHMQQIHIYNEYMSTERNAFTPFHILVTGGAGFIGSNFVHYIAKYHPEVAVTVLDSLTYAGNIANLYGLPQNFANNQYAFIHGDIRDTNLVNQLLNPRTQHTTAAGISMPAIDAVVHLSLIHI